MNDQYYMMQALSLAKKGEGFVNPNPLVGAVIVKNGQIIGRGYHQKYGEAHAEANAFASLTEPAMGATMYVTLEPCCHWGRNPPCTEAILKHKISRVVIGSADPNPLVNGNGAAILRKNGIEVTEGILKDKCDEINQTFFHFIKTGNPFVVMKYAMTLDGKIATCTGRSKWITGAAARTRVQQDRARHMAIMTGVGTVSSDDPLLTCRLPNSRSPRRIICDTRLRTPLGSQIVATARDVPVIIATCCEDQQIHKPYLDAGCEILVIPEADGHTDLKFLMNCLGERGIDSVYMEGGSSLNWSALRSGIVNRIQAYLAPSVFGGISAMGPVGGDGVTEPEQAFLTGPLTVTRLGNDLLLESEVIPCLQES